MMIRSQDCVKLDSLTKSIRAQQRNNFRTRDTIKSRCLHSCSNSSIGCPFVSVCTYRACTCIAASTKHALSACIYPISCHTRIPSEVLPQLLCINMCNAKAVIKPVFISVCCHSRNMMSATLLSTRIHCTRQTWSYLLMQVAL